MKNFNVLARIGMKVPCGHARVVSE